MMNIYIKFILLFFLLLINFHKQTYGQDKNIIPTESLLSKDLNLRNNISILGFKCLSNDITARVKEPIKDQNGELCAIIKVVTKDKHIFFESDALGIRERKDQPGEIWLYVPHGAKWITIKHERFGIIRNYFYGESIEKAMVYELQLYVPEVKSTEQFLVMNFSPNNAKIYINDVLQECNKKGSFSIQLPKGKYIYRVESPLYKVESSTFEIHSDQPTLLNVSLEPRFGFISVKSNKTKSDVFLNGKYVGKTPYKSDSLKFGIYQLRVESKSHISQERKIEIAANETSEFIFRLKHQKPNVFLLAQMGVALGEVKQMSYGVFTGFCWNLGGYVQFRTNGRFGLGKEAKLWNGEFIKLSNYSPTSKYYHATSCGFMARLMKYLYLYGGVGYLQRGLGWKTTDNEIVDILNMGGLMAEGGFVGRYKHITLSVGYMHAFPQKVNVPLEHNNNNKDLTFGIGYVF